MPGRPGWRRRDEEEMLLLHPRGELVVDLVEDLSHDGSVVTRLRATWTRPSLSPASRPSPSCSTGKRQSTSSSSSPRRRPATEPSSLVFPESFIPAYPSSVWAKALAGWAEPGATGLRAARPRVGRSPRRGRGPHRRDCEKARRVDRHRRHRGRSPSGPRRSTTPCSRTVPTARLPRDTASSSRRTTSGSCGPGRRQRPARDPHAARAPRRADLLGELRAGSRSTSPGSSSTSPRPPTTATPGRRRSCISPGSRARS